MATEDQNTDKTFNQKFKFADNYIPPLTEGKYCVTFTQDVSNSHFKNTKDFCVAVNTEILTENDIFSLYPLPEQVGDFSTELPFIVLNNPTYPWIKDATNSNGEKNNDNNNKHIPWPALIVVSEKEIIEETDVPYEELNNLAQEAGVYFPYDEDKNRISLCKPTDKIHVITITTDTFKKIMPTPEDRYWLTHCKKIDLSDAEDKTAQNDGYFSVILANRFPPNKADQIIPLKNKNVNINQDENEESINNKITNTVHLIAAYCYDNYKSDSKYNESTDVKLISLYHWKIYSDTDKDVVDKSFEPLIKGLNNDPDKKDPDNKNSEDTVSKINGSVHKQTLKPHFLRTGEKTYSLYHSPIQPINFDRAQGLNGESNYTSDRRLIYYKDQGIFDVSYAAAFNLGRIVTLSHKAEAQQIVKWRNDQRSKNQIKAQKDAINITNNDLKTVVEKLKEGKLK